MAALDFEDALVSEIDSELGDFFEIWTPAEFRAYLSEVSGSVTSLDLDVADHAACFTGSDLARWQDFKVRWTTFLKSEPSLYWIGTVRAAERFAIELREYVALYEKKCGAKATRGEIRVPKEEQANEFSGLGRASSRLWPWAWARIFS